MHINLVHRKTGKAERIDFNKDLSILQVKRLGATAAASSAHYFISVIANSEEDIDFVYNNYHNVPIPATPAKKAIWTGDMAVFLILNYPTSLNQDENEDESDDTDNESEEKQENKLREYTVTPP